MVRLLPLHTGQIKVRAEVDNGVQVQVKGAEMVALGRAAGRGSQTKVGQEEAALVAAVAEAAEDRRAQVAQDSLVRIVCRGPEMTKIGI